MVLDYHVGLRGNGGAVSLRDLLPVWTPYRIHRLDGFVGPGANIARIDWENLAFRSPDSLADAELRPLVLHNFRLDGGYFIVGDRVLSSADARHELAFHGAGARQLLRLGANFMKSVLQAFAHYTSEV